MRQELIVLKSLYKCKFICSDEMILGSREILDDHRARRRKYFESSDEVLRSLLKVVTGSRFNVIRVNAPQCLDS
jgi:hypothetical protein